MMKFSKSGAALAVALALAAGGAGAAVSLTDATTSGGSVILWSEAGGILTPTPSLSPAPAAALAGVLAGSAAAPGGNVELSKFAGPVTTLSGTLGGTAISEYTAGFAGVADAALELKLFEMLGQLPLHQISSFIGIVLVIVFFVTSSDSGSLVIDTISAGGKVHAPVPQRIFWCGFEGMVAIALLLGGGLTALQAMAVSTGLPFTFVLLGAVVAIIRGLMDEWREVVAA